MALSKGEHWVGREKKEHSRREDPWRVSGLDRLYAENLDWSLRLAFLLTRDAGLAEDVAQEAFIRVAGRFAHLRRPDAFAAYFRQAIVNQSRSYFRKRRREEAAVLRLPHYPSAPTDSTPNADDIEAALDELPYRQRAALVLRYYEDLSEVDSAVVLGCSTRAINSLVSRALRTLRERLGGDDVT